MAQLKIEVITSRLFGENAYVAYFEQRGDCLVFDPGFDFQQIVARLTELRLAPAAILNTHGHSDHIAGNEALKRVWRECPLLIGAGDAPKLTDPELNLSAAFGVALISPAADRLLHEGDVYEGAGLRLEILEIPGHSVGHIVFLCKDHDPWIVFGGDVLFQGSIGRTDFPDGDLDHLLGNIRSKLLTLPDETIVLPGHGPGTTIGAEKRSNPFLR